MASAARGVGAAGQLSRYGLGRLMFLVSDTLATLSEGTPGTPLTLGDHLNMRELAADNVAEQIMGLMGMEDAATLARQLAPQVSDLSDALGRPDLANTVASRFGSVRLIDYLRANIILAVDRAIDTVGVTQRSRRGTRPHPGHAAERGRDRPGDLPRAGHRSAELDARRGVRFPDLLGDACGRRRAHIAGVPASLSRSPAHSRGSSVRSS